MRDKWEGLPWDGLGSWVEVGGGSILTCSQRHCFLLRSECDTRVVKWALGWAAPASREHPSSSCKLRSASEEIAASKVNIELELSGVSDPT